MCARVSIHLSMVVAFSLKISPSDLFHSFERVIDSTLILSDKHVSVPVCVLPWHVLLGCIFVKNQGCVDEFVVGKTFVSCQISVFVTVFCRVCPDSRRSFTTRAPDNRMVCTGHWKLL